MHVRQSIRAQASRSLLLLATVLATAACSVQAVYFYVVEGQQRCFLEDVAQDTLIVGNYKNPDYHPWGEQGFTETAVKVIVTDPQSAIVLDKIASKEGRFAFTSAIPGEHSICLTTNSTRWFGEPKRFEFHLQLDVGATAIDYQEVAKKEHLETLALEVRKLNDKVQDISKAQQYHKNRETAFRNTSESTNARVQWWSVIQTLICLSSGIWQVFHLKTFFRKKKMV